MRDGLRYKINNIMEISTKNVVEEVGDEEEERMGGSDQPERINNNNIGRTADMGGTQTPFEKEEVAAAVDDESLTIVSL